MLPSRHPASTVAAARVRPLPRCALAEKAKTKLTSQHCASIATFLNDNFEAELLEWTLAKTEVGKTSRGKNMFSGGSWKPRRSVVEALDGEKLTLRVDVAVRVRELEALQQHGRRELVVRLRDAGVDGEGPGRVEERRRVVDVDHFQ